tara:strand:+ start:142 stop:258 length:117 start_codon:yes stop_codon:yes gene_type:complete
MGKIKKLLEEEEMLGEETRPQIQWEEQEHLYESQKEKK